MCIRFFFCVVLFSVFFFKIIDRLSLPLFLSFLSLHVFGLGSVCSFSWVISITSCSGSAVVSTLTGVSFDLLLFSDNSCLSRSTSMKAFRSLSYSLYVFRVENDLKYGLILLFHVYIADWLISLWYFIDFEITHVCLFYIFLTFLNLIYYWHFNIVSPLWFLNFHSSESLHYWFRFHFSLLNHFRFPLFYGLFVFH